ncbi:hypothetical protein [Xanthomonas phaseoli]|nr:hypothetical protein [Xanthomonas phaseoli]
MNFVAVNRKTGMAGAEGYMSQEDILKTSPQAQQAITGGGGGLY